MTWNYSGDPASSDRDAVRFRIGDTDPKNREVTDEEIAYLLAEQGNVARAALAAARALAVKYARMAKQVTRGQLRIVYNDRATEYADLATELSEELGEAADTVAGIRAPATTVSGREAALSDLERIPGEFRLGMHDEWSAG